MEKEEIKEILIKILEKLYTEHGILIYNKDGTSKGSKHGHERSIVAWFFHYLVEKIEALGMRINIDVEYNRKCLCPKLLEGKHKIPDLIIHKRYEDNNIACIEFKGWWSPSNKIEEDKEKVKKFIKEYKYKFGVVIIFTQKLEDIYQNIYIYTKDNL